MLKFNNDIYNCSGCTACYSICPVHCISMKKDQFGFLYPVSSDACIDCGACEKVCPWVKPIQKTSTKPKVYAELTHKHSTWQKSTSGGAFSDICKSWGDEETIIYGASWKGFEVHHISVCGPSNIAPLRKSKYLSSYLDDTFSNVSEDLKRGKRVIFSGSSCQVDGLKHFLRKDYENLLTIDIICHGQESPTLFKDYISWLSEQLQEDILSYEFRAKGYAQSMGYTSLVTTKKKRYYLSLDPYNQLFLARRGMRPSCAFNCRYQSSHRCSDITIADCKGLSEIFPHLKNSHYNYSTIICNTEKGLHVVESLKRNNTLLEYSVDDVIKFNPLFASKEPCNKEDFIKFNADYLEKGKEVFLFWAKPLRYTRPLRKNTVYRFIPSQLWPLFDALIKYIR